MKKYLKLVSYYSISLCITVLLIVLLTIVFTFSTKGNLGLIFSYVSNDTNTRNCYTIQTNGEFKNKFCKPNEPNFMEGIYSIDE